MTFGCDLSIGLQLQEGKVGEMRFEIDAWEENADTCKKMLKRAIQRGHNSRGPSGSLYI